MLALAALTTLLATPALADLFVARPANSTVGKAGEEFTIKWMDDGEAPSLADIGTVTIDLMIGSRTGNEVVQNVGTVDVSTASNITFTPNADIGESGQFYLFRFQSAEYKTADGQTYEKLSARFFAAQESLVANFSTATVIPSSTGMPTGHGASGATDNTTASGASASPSATGTGSGALSLAAPAGLALAGAAVAYLL